MESVNTAGRRGIGQRVWDTTLRMGFAVYGDGSREFFREPHLMAFRPAPVTDHEFREFIKFHSKGMVMKGARSEWEKG